MNNFDLIDDYITDRLKGQERELFENQLDRDPALKSEVDLQRQILEGIKQARAIEIKSMLNKVPIGGSVIHFDFSVLRLAAGLAGAGVLAASLYYYFKPEFHFEDASTDILKKTEQIQSEEGKSTDEVVTPSDSASMSPSPENGSVPAAKDKSAKPAREVKPKAVQKPAIDIVDPSDELNADESENSKPSEGRKVAINSSHVEVQIDSSNKKYDFHYQFEEGKLMLFGSFDRSLYEVIEVNGEHHSLFLFYKDQFYLLNDREKNITRLSPIKDAALIAKLKEFRK
jgi:hypothetical protein